MASTSSHRTELSHREGGGRRCPAPHAQQPREGPIADEAARPAALEFGRIARSGHDDYEIEPLPADLPLRLPTNATLSLRLGCGHTEGGGPTGAVSVSTRNALRQDGGPEPVSRRAVIEDLATFCRSGGRHPRHTRHPGYGFRTRTRVGDGNCGGGRTGGSRGGDRRPPVWHRQGPHRGGSTHFCRHHSPCLRCWRRCNGRHHHR